MASEVTQQAKESTSQAAQRARASAAENGGKLIARGRIAVERQSSVAGEQVNTIAQRARLTAAELRRQGEETPAKLAEQAADRAQQLGDWLKGLDADQLVSTVSRNASRIQPGRAVSAVEDFARRRPLVALATGATLGFLPARLLKASSGKRSAASNPPSPSTPSPSPSAGTPPSAGSDLTGGTGGTSAGTIGGAGPSYGTDQVDVVDTPPAGGSLGDAPLQSEPLTSTPLQSEPLTSTPLQSEPLTSTPRPTEPLADDADITWRGTVDPPR